MTIAIFGNPYPEHFSKYIQHLIKKLEAEHINLIVEEEFNVFLRKNIRFNKNSNTFKSYETLKNKADFLFSIGGDGTLLKAATYVRDSEIPILGICLGMQLLFEESKEFGNFKGLGLIKGKIIKLPNLSKSGKINTSMAKRVMKERTRLSETHFGVALTKRNLATATVLLTYRPNQISRLRVLSKLANQYEDVSLKVLEEYEKDFVGN